MPLVSATLRGLTYLKDAGQPQKSGAYHLQLINTPESPATMKTSQHRRPSHTIAKPKDQARLQQETDHIPLLCTGKHICPTLDDIWAMSRSQGTSHNDHRCQYCRLQLSCSIQEGKKPSVKIVQLPSFERLHGSKYVQWLGLAPYLSAMYRIIHICRPVLALHFPKKLVSLISNAPALSFLVDLCIQGCGPS